MFNQFDDINCNLFTNEIRIFSNFTQNATKNVTSLKIVYFFRIHNTLNLFEESN